MTTFISKPKLLSIIITITFLSPHILARAQPLPPTNDPDPNPDPKLHPDLQIFTSVTVTLVTAAFVLSYLVFYYALNHLLRRPVSRPGPDEVRPSGLAGRGLDPDVLRTFPVFRLSEVSGLRRPDYDGPLECAVCLSVFEGEDETLRLLPRCDHVFHVECVDTWLKDHSTCPYCRAELGGKGSPGESTRVPAGSVDELEEGGGEVNEMRNDVVEEGEGSWKGGKFWRCNSTGHVARGEREDGERFTLRLPEEVRNDIVTGKLSRSHSCGCCLA